MKSRDCDYVSVAVMILIFIAAVSPQRNASSQDCDDPKTKDVEQCGPPNPPKDPPKDPGNPPAQDGGSGNSSNNHPNVPSIKSTDTPTPTATATPTQTKVPTATATKPITSSGSVAIPAAGGEPDASDPNPLPAPDAAPLLPWLLAMAGILVGLILGAVGGATLSRRRARQALAPAELLNGEVPPGLDNDSTLFIKLTDHSVERFHPHLSTPNQITKVEVLGYDAVHKKEIVGAATAQTDLGTSSPHHKGAGPEEEGSENIRHVKAELYEEDIHFKYGGKEPHFKKDE